MTNPFEYPAAAHIRRHGPIGYANHAGYRPWLRDEFAFRCVYCLLREQWGRVRGTFGVDHFRPTATHSDLALDYDNLLYTCLTCNSTKGDTEIPNPLAVLTQTTVQVSEGGRLHTDSPQANCVIDLLGLNDEDAIEYRMTWIGIIALAAKIDRPLFQKLMGFPDDLPDLARLRPPSGNTRPEGITHSYHAKRKRGELPDAY